MIQSTYLKIIVASVKGQDWKELGPGARGQLGDHKHPDQPCWWLVTEVTVDRHEKQLRVGTT